MSKVLEESGQDGKDLENNKKIFFYLWLNTKLCMLSIWLCNASNRSEGQSFEYDL